MPYRSQVHEEQSEDGVLYPDEPELSELYESEETDETGDPREPKSVMTSSSYSS
jgi:hypothetical protein